MSDTRWIAKDGRVMRVSEMTPRHARNAATAIRRGTIVGRVEMLPALDARGTMKPTIWDWIQDLGSYAVWVFRSRP